MYSITYPTRDLALLDPQLRVLCERFLAECKTQGLNVIVTQTHRSAEYQNQLYAQGRNGDKRPIVTNAKAGNSAHEFVKDGKPWSRAFDIAIKYSDGTLNWDAGSKDWLRAGAIGLNIGLDWGGSWSGFKDPPHFQLKGWRTLP